MLMWGLNNRASLNDGKNSDVNEESDHFIQLKNIILLYFSYCNN